MTKRPYPWGREDRRVSATRLKYMIWEAVKLKGVKLTDSGLRLSFPGYSGEDTDQSSLYLSRA